MIRQGRMGRTGATTIGGLVAAITLALAPATHAAVSFAPKTDYTTGNGPAGIAIGDLNGDGRPDLAVANELSGAAGSVSVLLADGPQGSFTTKADFPTGSHPEDVAIRDVNTNGRSDLIVANSGGGYGGSVSALLDSTPQGSSFRRTNFPATQPNAVAVNDLNGDGRPDLATSSFAPVSVLLASDAPGNFAPKAPYQSGGGADLAVGDLNRDGRPDLVTANESKDSVSVLLAAGAPGKFGPKTDIDTGRGSDPGDSPQSVAIGDVNRDGRLDIAVANDGRVSVLLAAAAPGTFGPRTDFAVPETGRSVASADFNEDGRPDLAVSSVGERDDTGGVSMLLASGAEGSFAPQVRIAAPGAPGSVASGDLNADGRPDLAVSNRGSDSVSVLLNTTSLSALGARGPLKRACAGTSRSPQRAFVNTIRGTAGDDTLRGTPESDLIIAGAGDDRVRAGDGNDYVIAGPGNDDVSLGAGNDRAHGGSGRDFLRGRAGRDRLRGGPGRDRLRGGAGDDAIRGRAGADRITGGAGCDRVSGGTGPDTISGGAARDLIFGGSGNDELFGGAGDDLLDGDSGHDRVFGQAGSDRLLGEAGNDLLDGGSGRDRLRGHGGRDRLRGGSGRDRTKEN